MPISLLLDESAAAVRRASAKTSGSRPEPLTDLLQPVSMAVPTQLELRFTPPGSATRVPIHELSLV